MKIILDSPKNYPLHIFTPKNVPFNHHSRVHVSLQYGKT